MKKIKILVLSDIHDTVEANIMSYLNSYKNFCAKTEEIAFLLTLGDIPWEIYSKIVEYSEKKNIQLFSVPGNHDNYDIAKKHDLHFRVRKFNFYPEKTLLLRLYDDTPIKPQGITLFGCGGTHSYKSRQKYVISEVEIERACKMIEHVDIFASHSPAFNIHDDPDDSIHCGFKSYTSAIESEKMKIFIHGHMHVNKITDIGKIQVIGVHGIKEIEIPVRFLEED